ncbi:uncharacterized protein FOMMEDRAFT_27003 [Fomitiporia mediterranea MF3/22]|uniref:uncharacterized protein n=1 Tax=Fomitiporia mediterranea (strain MF3/22) TaxID=694068 RepID=UPI0004409133|nr:uncharacterized protein FOMMEDRAFT_27003 [Fomitiporia mediterranea MF3/22]EJD06292.1 hypothetical protein FOMMEDRAFT_27003 [Fomitiporia mediterranea MF3/22]
MAEATGFQLVSCKQSKCKKDEEVDTSNILSEKRHCIHSVKKHQNRQKEGMGNASGDDNDNDVGSNSKGLPGLPTDKHYKCYHGSHHILTITKKMKGATIGLETYLHTKVPDMYALFLALKRYSLTCLPTNEEIAIANGSNILTAQQLKELTDAFACQAKGKQGPWDQAKFEHTLAEWIVHNDEPFTVVESLSTRIQAFQSQL